MWKLRTPSPATVIAIAAFVIATGGVAIGSVAARDGKITACYSTKNGALRLIDAGKKCRKKKSGSHGTSAGGAGRPASRVSTASTGSTAPTARTRPAC